MTGRAPLVSVIVPAYNAGRTIDAALASVFAQTYPRFEAIVVDDGSTDDTAERVAAWGDRVVYRRQSNGGPARARNQAIRIARGDLLAFLDADDVWLPTKLERQVAYFRAYPDTGLLHTAVHRSHAPMAAMYETAELPPDDLAPPAPRFCELFHCDQDVVTVSVMVPRRVAIEAGLFDERREIHVEDWDLWLRIAARHPVGYLPTPLAVYRPGGEMSAQHERSFSGQSLVIEKSVPLCAASCAKHRADPAACLGARQHFLQSQLGYVRFWRGEMLRARDAYRAALSVSPEDRRARWYLAASYLPPAPLRAMRRLRQAARRRASGVPRVKGRPRNLVHDTMFRRARAAVARAAHAVDDFVSLAGRDTRRILFEAASPLSVSVFQPVYERLRNDARLEIWFTANDRAWDPTRIFAAAGIRDRVLPIDKVRGAKFDAYINTDFWNMTWLPRRTRRVHLFHGVAGKYGLDAPRAIAPVVASFDRLMFANRDRLSRYAEAGLVDPASPAAALVGYPKVDCLVDGSLDRSAILSSLGSDGRIPTVLYAPTWSPYSSLNSVGEDIIRVLARLGLNVVVKLHDRSLDASDRGAGGVDWRERLARLCREWRVHLAEGADACPYLYVADVLVTDHSSVGFEFMLLDRPIVVVDCPELLQHSLVNPQKAALLRSASHVVSDADGVGRMVRAALDAPAAGGPRRRAIANELFYRPGSATLRAVECIYEVLAMPVLAPAKTVAAADAVTMSPLEVRPRQT